MSEDALKRAGELVALAAIAEWNKDIWDAPMGSTSADAKRCIAYIDTLTRACNFGPYRGNGCGIQWCTMFASMRWVLAGGLRNTMLAHFCQSTLRMREWAQYHPWNGSPNDPKPTDPSDRRLYVDLQKTPSFAPRAGDIMIVGDGAPTYGDHGVIVLSYDAATHFVSTIGGNGGGIGPHGNSREGVSKRTFPLHGAGYHMMFLIRPAFADLVAERG